jgi:hypothetical protein
LALNAVNFPKYYPQIAQISQIFIQSDRNPRALAQCIARRKSAKSVKTADDGALEQLTA